MRAPHKDSAVRTALSAPPADRMPCGVAWSVIGLSVLGHVLLVTAFIVLR